MKEQCEKYLEKYNDHFKMYLHVRKLTDEIPHGQMQHLFYFCKKLDSLFMEYWNIYKCIPEETWKMYDILKLEGLQEQVFLKKALDRLNEHLKERPKLIVKGRLTDARKKTIRKIVEGSDVQSTNSTPKTSV